MTLNLTPRAAWIVASAVLLTACAGLPAARMALPAPLAEAAAQPVPGIGSGREGSFAWDGGRVQFSRGRDRLDLFGVVSVERSPVRYSWTRADGSRLEAACRGRQDGVTLGVLQAHPRPFSLSCEWQGPTGRVAVLELAAPSWVPGTRAERSGRFMAGATTLTLQSVHRVAGSPLPLEQAIGYVLLHEGRAVGAVELNGATPRLWRPAPGDALAEPVTLAALAFALLWDPAGAGL